MATAVATTKALACSVGLRRFAGGLRAGAPAAARDRIPRHALIAGEISLQISGGCMGCNCDAGLLAPPAPGCSRADCSASRVISSTASSRGGGAGRGAGRKMRSSCETPPKLYCVKTCRTAKAEDHPGPIPVQRHHRLAGEKAEIEQAAADQQRQHRDEEDPVQQRVDGARLCRPRLKNPRRRILSSWMRRPRPARTI